MEVEKEQVLEAFREYEIYLASLRTSVKTDEDAYKPMAEGKWSIAEVVLHLAEWDRFIHEERLAVIKKRGSFNSFPDIDEFNREAVEKADQLSFSDILIHAQKQRGLLEKEVESLQPSEWASTFPAGDREVSLSSYFERIVEHDWHHLRQIDSFLTEKKQRS